MEKFTQPLPSRVHCPLVVCLVFSLGIALCASATAPPAEPAMGGWIGWTYLGEAGDLPLRIWLRRTSEGLAVTFDGIPWGESWPAELSTEAGRARLSTETPKGSKIRLDGEIAGGVWKGTADFSGNRGEFELLHAPELAPVSAESYADLAGFVRMADGDVLEARRLDWGDIVLRSIRSGEQRTLLPTGEDRFVTGPAIYVPTPVEARWEVLRNEGSHAVEAVVRRAAGGEGSVRGEPFDLRSEELKIESAADDDDPVAIAATILRIDDERRRAGVVILGGGGWQTRGDVAFRARNLAALGFAVLTFDRRGHGESAGEDPVPFAVTAGDAAVAARLLRRRDDVGKVGYVGISRGGWTAPLAAAADPDAAFLILLVPPATSPARQEQGRRLAVLRDEGYGKEEIALAGRMLDAAWEYVATGKDEAWSSFEALRRQTVERGLPESILPPASRDPAEWSWSRMNMLYDPLPVLRKTRIPVLAIYAEDDRSVITKVHRPLLEKTLEEADNDDVSVVTLPEVGHGLGRPWVSPHHRATGVGAEGFDVIMEWARQRGLIQ